MWEVRSWTCFSFESLNTAASCWWSRSNTGFNTAVQLTGLVPWTPSETYISSDWTERSLKSVLVRAAQLYNCSLVSLHHTYSCYWGNRGYTTANWRHRTAHCALHDAANRLYQSSFYFQNVTLFHGARSRARTHTHTHTHTDVVSFTTLRKRTFRCAYFHETRHHSSCFCGNLSTECYPNWPKK